MANSFLRATLLKEENRRKLLYLAGPHPREASHAGLKNISHLYQYVNTPPLAIGVTAHKVAESVLRSMEYNRLPNNGLGERPTQMWPAGEFYPFNSITSNFSPQACRLMFELFLKENYQLIDNCLNLTWEYSTTTNSDVLTKGRQTWDPINERSVPSAQAYREAVKLYDTNLPYRKSSLIGFLNAFHEELGLQQMDVTKRERVQSVVNMRDPKSGLLIKVTKSAVKVRTQHLEDEEVYNNSFKRATSFCAYLKSKERGKLERRAIASANMVLRAHLHIVEKFHLLISQTLPGSVIGVGGEEKKNKILEVLGSLQGFMGTGTTTLQATEDVTKYNECLAPECFALFHHVIMDNKTRERLKIPTLPPTLDSLRDIFVHTFYLLANKRIWMGKGHAVANLSSTSNLNWTKDCVPMMNETTKQWFEKAADHIEEGYLRAPYGMLMGMLNATSTTMVLATVNWRKQPGTDCKSARSSDDSMTVFSAKDEDLLRTNIQRVYDNMKLMGVNISEKKSRFFRQGFGEVTSWYQDGEFTGQYGVETSALRPTGINPADDFHAIAAQTATSLRTGTTNIFGAQARLCIGVDNCRRLWKVNQDFGKRPGVSGEVQVLSDGGKNPWNWSTCHLPEIPLKERYVTTEEEKSYLLKVMNPDNPFTGGPAELTTYSVELGQLVDIEMDIPRNLFNLQKRSNATKRSLLRAEEDTFKKVCNEVNEVFEMVDPVSALITPRTTTKMSTSLAHQLSGERGALRSAGVEFSPEELNLIDQAIDLLGEGEILE
nr:MAG: polymerase PB1 [Orthomyxoviridae sp.]